MTRNPSIIEQVRVAVDHRYAPGNLASLLVSQALALEAEERRRNADKINTAEELEKIRKRLD